MIQEIGTVCNQLNKEHNLGELWNRSDSWKLEAVNKWFQNLGIPDMEIITHVGQGELLLMNSVRSCLSAIVEPHTESS